MARNDQEKHRARRKLRTAIERGFVTKPSCCSVCGQTPRPARDGRSLLHAHHFDGYADPLRVEWLCATCHANEHKHFGIESSQAKIDLETVKLIRESSLSSLRLAKIVPLHSSQIRKIRNNKFWRTAHLTGEGKR